MDHVEIISAGAGSGKTYKLTHMLADILDPGNENSVDPSGIIVTTFTIKGAAEIRERARKVLLEKGHAQVAANLNSALIGTVHSVCSRILQQFAFEAGISPKVEAIDENDLSILFAEALAGAMDEATVMKMDELAAKFGMEEGNWRNEVRNIIDNARANGIAAAELKNSKEKSVTSLTEILGTPREIDLHDGLLTTISEAIRELEGIEPTMKKVTKVFGNGLKTLRQYKYKLENGYRLTWRDIKDLSQIKGGKEGGEATEIITEYLEGYYRSREHFSDIEAFTCGLFEIAATAMDHFRTFKDERRLIDFQDMETLVLELLKREEVRQQLGERLKVLMVDEFQDTSPMQLAIFLELCRIAKKVVWVGDPKQAIYGFRGTDPALMEAAVKAILAEKKPETLDTSYRSREEIVHFSNALFIESFKNDFPPEQVELRVDRNEDTEELGHGLKAWSFDNGTGSSNQSWYFSSLAKEIKKLVDNGTQIIDKDTKAKRGVRYGDIGLLCNTNSHCRNLASALQSEGIDVATAGSGLNEQAEVILLKACLRKVAFPRDTLATTEIMLLTAEDPDMSVILQQRLEFLQTGPENHTDWPQENHPVIDKINGLRKEAEMYPVGALVQFLISRLEIHRYLLKWGDFESRLSNLEKMVAYAAQYENSCLRFLQGATVGGFLLWLEKSGSDEKGVATGANAVNVSTVHKAKGLDWPVVIAACLENELKFSPFGVTVVDDNQEFDFHDPLANRWIRYWPWAFGYHQGKEIKTPGYTELVEACEQYHWCQKAALQEEKRVLYVALTRARDYLIMPKRLGTRCNRQVLQRHCSQEGYEFLRNASESGTFRSPWRWNGYAVDFKVENCFYDLNVDHERQEREIRYLPDSPGSLEERIPLFVSPSGKSAEVNEAVTVILDVELPPVELPASTLSSADVGNFLHHTLAAYPLDGHGDIQSAVVSRLISGYKIGARPENLCEAMAGFYNHLQGEFPNATLHRELPVQWYDSGSHQIHRGVVDCLLELDNHLILIDHKSHHDRQQAGSEDLVKASRYFAPQLKQYAIMLEAAFGKPVQRSLIYYVVSGRLVEVEFHNEESGEILKPKDS